MAKRGIAEMPKLGKTAPMKVVITSIELKTVWKFFALSRNALDIRRQLKQTDCVELKTQGFWKLHYTMTRWNSEAELKAFARSGAHLEAMKKSAGLARTIRTLTFDGDKLPDWKSAKRMLLEKGKTLSYS